jgi:hypothetical protein
VSAGRETIGLAFLSLMIVSTDAAVRRFMRFSVMATQGHSIIPGQLEAALRNGRPASVTFVECSKIVSGMSTGAYIASRLRWEAMQWRFELLFRPF